MFGLTITPLMTTACSKPQQQVVSTPRITAPMTFNSSLPLMVNQINPKGVFIPANGVAIVPFTTNIQKGIIGPDNAGTVTTEGNLVRIENLKPGATTLRVQTIDGQIGDYPLIIINPQEVMTVSADGDLRVIEGVPLKISLPAKAVKIENLLNDAGVQTSRGSENTLIISVAKAQATSPVIRLTLENGQIINLRLLVLAAPKTVKPERKE